MAKTWAPNSLEEFRAGLAVLKKDVEVINLANIKITGEELTQLSEALGKSVTDSLYAIHLGPAALKQPGLKQAGLSAFKEFVTMLKSKASVTIVNTKDIEIEEESYSYDQSKESLKELLERHIKEKNEELLKIHQEREERERLLEEEQERLDKAAQEKRAKEQEEADMHAQAEAARLAKELEPGWGIESDPIKAEKLQTKLPEFQDVRLPKDAGFESEESVTQAVAENLASVSNPKNRQDFNDLLKLLKEKVLIKEINLSALSNPDSGIVLSPYQLLSLCDAIEKNGKVTHLHLGAAKLNTDQAFEVLQRLPTIAAPNTSLVSVNTSDCILPSNEDKLRKAQQAIKNLEKQLEFQQQFPMALKGKTQLAHRVASDIVELSRQAPSRNKVTIGNKDDKEEDQFKVKEQFTAKYLEDVVLKRLNDKVQVKEQQKKVKPGGFHFFAINFLQRGRENKKQNQDITLIRDTLKSLGRFENIHKPEEKLKQTHACLKQACAKAQDPWLQNYLRGYMRNTEASSLKLESPKTTRPKK